MQQLSEGNSSSSSASIAHIATAPVILDVRHSPSNGDLPDADRGLQTEETNEFDTGGDAANPEAVRILSL